MNSATLSSPSATLSGRELALKRRKAMALNGKAALARSQPTVAVPLAAAANSRASAEAKPAPQALLTTPVGDRQAALDKGASGRQVAMHRRMVLAQTGRPATSSTDSSGAGRRPVGRVRPQVNSPSTAPEKVEEGHALRGRSNPASVKVAVSTTLREQKVTGIEVGRSANVTGDESGACRGITGTEYLSAERYDEFCASRPEPGPKKVHLTVMANGKKVSGLVIDRPAKVTGDEAGAARSISGTAYMKPFDSASVPLKVGQTHTAGGKVVTGTRFGPSENVSGGDAGACRGITGTEYLSQEQFIASCGTQAPVRPLKVSVMSSRAKQSVSGTEVGRSSLVTGDEPGSCQHITGSQYYNPESFGALCATRTPVKAAPMNACAGRGQPSPAMDRQEPVRSTAVISAAAVTGDRPGAGGSAITGDARGACKPVSGTPYIGADNSPPACAVSGRFLLRQSSVEATAPSPAPLAFSIQSPARVAHDQTLSQVTGNSFGIDRITGAANKAGGLITGTPEFRHPVASQPLASETQLASSPAGKVTGEGSQAGREVTGDAWHAMRQVTGTEGASSLMRNPSAKGTPRGMGVNAQVFRNREKPAIPVLPESRITGSSGSSGRGASVTLSGGARG